MCRDDVSWMALAALALPLLIATTGCKGGTGQPDAGPPPDICNSQQEAVSSPACQLAVNGTTPTAGYISAAGDKDWYSIQLPGTVTARSLLQVTAGYGGALGTPVDFSATLLKSDGNTALSSGVDHPTGAPHYVNLVVTLDPTYANQTLLVLVGDSSNTQFDDRTPYHIQVTLVDNPDSNEPNDTVANATPIPLSGGVGTAIGYLATPNDVDMYTFTVPAGRQIVYVDVNAPALSPPAPPQLLLSYQLFDQTNTKISEAQALPLLAADLATARLSNIGGSYRLVVQGFKTSPTQSVPGDVRFKYTVTIKTLNDLDTNEPNDSITAAQATPYSLGNGATLSKTGRISYVGDADWYILNLPAAGTASTLHYTLTPSGTAGRFPPLPGPLDRLVRISRRSGVPSRTARIR